METEYREEDLMLEVVIPEKTTKERLQEILAKINTLQLLLEFNQAATTFTQKHGK